MVCCTSSTSTTVGEPPFMQILLTDDGVFEYDRHKISKPTASIKAMRSSLEDICMVSPTSTLSSSHSDEDDITERDGTYLDTDNVRATGQDNGTEQDTRGARSDENGHTADEDGASKGDTNHNRENGDDDRRVADDLGGHNAASPEPFQWTLVQIPLHRRQLDNSRCAKTTALRIAADAMHDICGPVFASGEDIDRKLAALEPFCLLVIPMMNLRELELYDRVKYQQIVAAISDLGYDLAVINYGEDRVSDALIEFFRDTHLDESFSYSFPLEWEAFLRELHPRQTKILGQKLGREPLPSSIHFEEQTPEEPAAEGGAEIHEARLQDAGYDQVSSLADTDTDTPAPSTQKSLKRNAEPVAEAAAKQRKLTTPAGLSYKSNGQMHCRGFPLHR